MEKLSYEILIKARVEKVYDTVIDALLYKKWASAFDPTSYYEGNWDKGSTIYFIGTNEQGEKQGMVSIVEENMPYKFISLKHIGIIENGVILTDGPKTAWAPLYENYYLSKDNGYTKFHVEMDPFMDYIDYFNETWPKALQLLKELSEQ